MTAAGSNHPLSMDVVIPTFGRGDRAWAIAHEIRGQLKPCEGTYIVWQGATTPAAAEKDGIRLLRSSPPNLPRARNRGVAASSGEIVLFLDDDVEIRAKLIENHRRSYRDPKVGAVAGNIDDPLFDRSQDAPSVYDKTTGELRQNFAADTDRESISFMGANMSIRRSALVRVGGFDEAFGGNGLWEEIDAAFRLRAAGYTIRYVSNASVKHVRLASGGCRRHRTYRYLYHQFANTAYFAAKHAPHGCYGSWIRFWWHRLEYLSRTGRPAPRHDPLAIASALVGAVHGTGKRFVSGAGRRYL